jgi:type II secretory pathway pseudopilin PulG
MTLVELLVVVAILALLTAVAMMSTDVTLGQARYDATIRTLNGIQDAVLGIPGARQTDGTLLVSGFLADIGRLPVAVADGTTTGLGELWSNPNGLLPFSIYAATHDPEVLVACGWRGPYLQLPIGSSVLYDGWGYPLELLDLSGNPASPGEGIAAVLSLGSDGQPGGTGYAADITLALNQLAQTMTSTVSGNVYVLNANGVPQNPTNPTQVNVMLYGPNPATGGLLETPISTTVNNGVVSYTATTTYGPRYLRAYYGSLPVTSNPGTWKSPIVRIQQSGVISLQIQQPGTAP